MKNFKTTIGGIITALGAACTQSNDKTVQIIGLILAILGPLLLGAVAKDANVTGGTVAQPTPPTVQREVVTTGIALECQEDPAKCKGGK